MHDATSPALDQSELDRHYRLIVENASDAAFHLVGDAVLWISPRVTDILGWAPEDLVGHGLDHLLHPDERDEAARMRADAAAAGRSCMDFVRMRRKDGEYVWVAAALRPYTDPDTGEAGLVGSLRDATERVAREKEVADAARAYRLLSENARDIVFSVGEAGTIRSVSPSVYEGLGWKPEDLIGTFLPALCHPDDRDEVTKHRRAILAGATPGRVEFRAQARGGAWRWFSATAARMDDDEGSPPGIALSWRHIDDLVRARDDAQNEAARLRATLDSSMDVRISMLALRDAAGKIVDFRYEDVNDAACRANGMSRDRMLGVRFLDVVPGTAGLELLQHFAHAVDDGMPCVLDDVEFHDEIRGGTRRYDIRADVVGEWLTCAWRDVTDRSIAADETAHAADHFRRVAENAADLVMRVENGVVSWASRPAGPLSVSPGQPFDDVLDAWAVAAEDGPRADLDTDVAFGTPYAGIWMLRGTDGVERAALVRAVAVGRGIDPRTDLVVSVTFPEGAPPPEPA